MGNSQYVTDLIGDEYLDWKTGDKVLISTPTGSGKSTFVIASLLKTAVENEKHIVYYCNRKVLNDQFEVQSKLKIEEAFGKETEVTEKASKHLHIFTYQSSECQKNYPKVVDVDAETGEELLLEPKDIMYYVFDEAHYFVSDALINEGTNFWFNLRFNYGISVFLTATPKPLISLFVGWDRLYSEGNRNLYEDFKQEDKHKAVLKRLEPVFLKKMLWEFKQVNIIPKMPQKGTLADEAVRRNRNALESWFEALANHFESDKRITYEYSYQPDYSYIEETYFTDYEELLPEIMKNVEEKWLIFVDDEEIGGVLETTYKEKGLSVCFLSRSRIRRGGKHKETYDYIVLEELLPTRILIATSALDCGINIKDKAVKNVVIVSDNETTFLQMLGRRRVESGEKIRLFIKSFTYARIHNRYCRSREKLRFSVKFSLKNELGLIRSGKSTYYRDGNSYGTFLSAHEIKSLPKESLRHKDSLLSVSDLGFLNADCNGHIKERTINGWNYEQIMREFEYSKTAFLNIMLRLYDYEKAIGKYRTVEENFSELCEHFLLCFEQVKEIKNEADMGKALLNDPVLVGDRFKKFQLNQVRNPEETIDFRSHTERDNFFYLKHQLRWIGKEYNGDNWLNYSQTFDELLRILNELAETKCYLKEFDNYHEQKEFSMKCLELMQKLPAPPVDIAKDASRYGKGDKPLHPGIDKLNKCFKSLEVPFRIESKQVTFKDIGKRKSCWYIVRIEE